MSLSAANHDLSMKVRRPGCTRCMRNFLFTYLQCRSKDIFTGVVCVINCWRQNDPNESMFSSTHKGNFSQIYPYLPNLSDCSSSRPSWIRMNAATIREEHITVDALVSAQCCCTFWAVVIMDRSSLRSPVIKKSMLVYLILCRSTLDVFAVSRFTCLLLFGALLGFHLISSLSATCLFADFGRNTAFIC